MHGELEGKKIKKILLIHSSSYMGWSLCSVGFTEKVSI